jgi:hypothetical protein
LGNFLQSDSAVGRDSRHLQIRIGRNDVAYDPANNNRIINHKNAELGHELLVFLSNLREISNRTVLLISVN